MPPLPKTGLLFIPTPATGHLISNVELASRLLAAPGSPFSITILSMRNPDPAWAATTSSYISSVETSSLGVAFDELPAVDPPNIPKVPIEPYLALYVESYRPLIAATISRHLAASPVPIGGVVLDLFCASLIDTVDGLGLPAYVYFTSPASTLSLFLYSLTLHKEIPGELREFEGLIDIPGLPPVPPLSMPDLFMDKRSPGHMAFVMHGQRFKEARGILVNTFAELEPGPLKALGSGSCLPDHPTPKVYPVGPVLALENSSPNGHECVEWLDGQPDASVVFLCFGSLGSFGKAQVEETAAGLERSGHRFLWVLRSPPAEGVLPTDANLDEVLPKGFLERTRGRGMVWPKWAPQAEILAHPAVGGFVTHCGWNSCLESLWFGVPMIGWPLYAEQHLNAFEMAEDMGVCLELEIDREKDDYVKSEELERGVRCLMGDSEEGKRVRKRAHEMKVAARKAVEEGGSAYVALESFIHRVIEEMPSSE